MQNALSLNINFNKNDGDGSTALILACKQNNVELVKLFMEYAETRDLPIVD